jgi:hypothetical protein
MVLGSMSFGTPISVQQRAMRHRDIRVTMNVYGDPVNDTLKDASSTLKDASSKNCRADCQSRTDEKRELSFLNLGWETGIEPATVGATVRCSAS